MREQLAANITGQSIRAVTVIQGYPRDPVDLVINATSLGLKPGDPLPIDLAWLQSRRPARVYDMIYRPKETALLRAARNGGMPGGQRPRHVALPGRGGAETVDRRTRPRFRSCAPP